MTIKCSVFIATSLDGFIAREDGSIDWLERANAAVPEGEDCGYAQFMASVDALAMGRATFDQVRRFDPWPYAAKPVYVLSRSLKQLPPATPRTVRLLDVEPAAVVRAAQDAGYRHLYIDGGRTIQAFLSAGLVSMITITVVPVLLGSGIRLFGSLEEDLSLMHRSTRSFPFGFVQSTYAIEGAVCIDEPVSPPS